MKNKIMRALLGAGLFILIAAPLDALAGTATGSSGTGAGGGQTCGKISKKSRDNTGAMTVGTVTLNGTAMTLNVDYKVRAGTDKSTRPVIEFTNPLPANANVEVKLSTIEAGTFTVNLELEHCRR